MQSEYKEDLICYSENSYEKKQVIWELFYNAFRTLESVYLFNHFDEFCRQLQSSKQEDKQEIYWNASYYEKLIDYVKISIAFETYNKVCLLRNGILVHKIQFAENNELKRNQEKGIPVRALYFFKNKCERPFSSEDNFNGLFKNLATINYFHTLNNAYQEIIGLNKQFVFELKKINEKRNRLHLLIDFREAFIVEEWIKRWAWIKDISIKTIETELVNSAKELNRC